MLKKGKAPIVGKQRNRKARGGSGKGKPFALGRRCGMRKTAWMHLRREEESGGRFGGARLIRKSAFSGGEQNSAVFAREERVKCVWPERREPDEGGFSLNGGRFLAGHFDF